MHACMHASRRGRALWAGQARPPTHTPNVHEHVHPLLLLAPGPQLIYPGFPRPVPPALAETMGLCPEVLRAVKRKGYRLPTPIQRKAMPLIMQGLDLVGMARTGSGKTAAFVVPMIQR